MGPGHRPGNTRPLSRGSRSHGRQSATVVSSSSRRRVIGAVELAATLPFFSNRALSLDYNQSGQRRRLGPSVHTRRAEDRLRDSFGRLGSAFRRYDDVDFVTDLPTAFFYREFLEAYPRGKAILTVRDIDSWWTSVQHHWEVRCPLHRSTFLGSLTDALGWKKKKAKGQTCARNVPKKFAEYRIRIDRRNRVPLQEEVPGAQCVRRGNRSGASSSGHGYHPGRRLGKALPFPGGLRSTGSFPTCPQE